MLKLYSIDELEQIPFTECEEGRLARAFFQIFLSAPTSQWISNIHTTVYCLQIDQFFLPITVNERGEENSYVTSTEGIVRYAKEEAARLQPRWLRPCLRTLLGAAQSFLRAARVDCAVTVNNWLFSTNLYPDVSAEQVERILVFLQERFPEHCILWRSLNTDLNPRIMDALRQRQCVALCMRRVYLYDPRRPELLNAKQRWKQRVDRKLIAQKGYEVQSGDQLSDGDFRRIHSLYGMLYLEKYTAQNPQFTVDFLREAGREGLFSYRVLRKAGRIDAVLGYWKRHGVMTGPIFGYDTRLAQTVGLYRMLTALALGEAEEKLLFLHHSAGAGQFKRVRGMQPQLDYMIIYTQHLPRWRRFPWVFLASLFNHIGRPLALRLKL
jgi:hypothetical protein